MWVHDIDYEMLQLFIFSPLLPLTSMENDSQTNILIQILFSTTFHAYPII